ncbi:hypothetical protein [Fimbriimonas ginsengisoli]|uniref:Uncharacterized protein n=1 Tax=Fimbriimonas ginsengisoli Gsoil 348 TaxID=661478 RepID=A0A068NW77_FIMGI|nr:hypothetical protein [Fimbriimonas ginsengisoli]AIE87592.1 hypothetical protein OP10G_4224 [Fimbriimonas ginsengisoli Gsoil 348]
MSGRLLALLPALILAGPPGGAGKEKPVLVVNFESTPDGGIPDGFTKQGNCEVTSKEAHRGKKCLQINPAERGPRRIVLKGDLVKNLGGSHWGRLYLKVKIPTPVPVVPAGQSFAVIHSTIVEGAGTSPLHNDPVWVRLADTCTGPDGGLQWLYNVWVTPRPEFGKGSPYKYKFNGKWMLVEWYVDHATQTYQLFIDGKEIPEVKLNNGAGHFEGTEIPPFFDSLAFGWNNYQSASEGFTAWIDDIAVAHLRIGAK